jgi:hypothetical protein
MSEHPWVENFPGAVTVCDPNGIVLELNDKAAQSFAVDGGRWTAIRRKPDANWER